MAEVIQTESNNLLDEYTYIKCLLAEHEISGVSRSAIEFNNFKTTSKLFYPKTKELTKNTIQLRDKKGGINLYEEFIQKINSDSADNEAIVSYLRKINNLNAYDFFMRYKAKNALRFDFITRTLMRNVNTGSSLGIKNVLVPIKSLLMQAKAYGYQETKEYKNLEQRHRELTQLLVKTSDEKDSVTSRVVAKDLDITIDLLLTEMSKKIT